MKKNLHDTQKIPIIRPEEINSREHPSGYPQNTHTATERNRKQPKQTKNNSIKKSVISFILTLTILVLIISVGLYSVCSRVNYVPVQNGITINTDNITNNIYNILLIGTDKEDDGASRSDSMILVTVNKNTEKIKMTSFMRDLWVDIPGHDNGRLNAAYSIGGAGLLMTTIEHNFDVQIDDYILVDFEMFKQLIDELGGINIEITAKEAKFINRTTKATVVEGENTLNGNDALIYCRIRKLDSDFMRTQRQRKVMNAILNEIKGKNILDIATAGINILPLITTDISPFKIIIKGLTSVSAVNYDIEQLRIPADKTYKNQTIKSQAVLVADFEENIHILHEFIYN